MSYRQLISKLKAAANPKNVEGMARFGINSEKTLGVGIPFLRKMAKEIGKNQALAEKLWDSEIHEARILASMVADPKQISEDQMDYWVKGFDSWDVCDQACMNLFDKTPFAYKKAKEWVSAEPEFVRRAGFALMAALAFHDKKAVDKDFEQFFPLIKKYSTDPRNFVRKAVNWALRQTGKRNQTLLVKAIKLAEEIEALGIISNSKSARWIAKDALRELRAKQ